MSLPLADAVRGMIHVLGDAEWEADARKIADNIAKLERENAALREALQNCAISASGQNWQQIAWIVEGALYDPRKEAQP